MKNLPETTPKTAAELFELPQIEQAHLRALEPAEREEFNRLFAEKMDNLMGRELDAFITQVEALLEPEQVWEYNHEKIVSGINSYLQQYGCVPPRTHLAQVTGLSRSTIYRHMQAFEESNAGRDERDSFDIMHNQVRAKVLQAAMNGDLRAAKMILNAPKLREQAAKKDVVNNYLQINKTVVNQQVIQQLNPEVLNQIEQLIAKELKEKQPDTP